MYGGKRYRTGTWPAEEFPFFDPSQGTLIYDSLPPEDAYPEYPPPPPAG